MKRKTVAELVRDNEMRILRNKKMKEEYEKRLTMMKENANYWKRKYSQNVISSLKQKEIDVICTNCYAMITIKEMDEHSLHCSISVNANCFSNSLSFDECNQRLYKMHSALKEKSNEINDTHNSTIIKYYNALLNLTYQILLNNNSYDDLQNYKKNLSMLVDFSFNTPYLHIQSMLNIFSLRLEQLTEIKSQTMTHIAFINFDDSLSRLSAVNSDVKENDFTLFTNVSI